MGLAVEVGMLADLLENDPEGADWLRESFDSVNAVLADNKLPPHGEPESLDPLDNRASLLSYPYSFLHHLRRVAAHAAEKPGWIAKPFPEASDPAADPLVDKHSGYMESHLLCHSDCEGFYLPIQFNEVIFDDQDRIPGGMLGSSYMLQKELIAVAPALGIRLENGQLRDQEADRINREVEAESPLWIEKAVWLSLFEAARLSIQHKVAVCFA
jgi:hypothetical protein